MEKYWRSRRAMTEFRSEELLAAVELMASLNTENIPELDSLGLSFIDALETGEIHYMGHSFGASTSLHAAWKIPPSGSVIAHEPVSEWLPDSSRFSLYEKERLNGSAVNCTAKWIETSSSDPKIEKDLNSIHDTNLLFLFSHEWSSKEWSGTHILRDMHQRKKFGSEEGISSIKVIEGAHHNEFSDTCMLTPTWLARETNLTGSRNPLHTASDIHKLTMEFLEGVRK